MSITDTNRGVDNLVTNISIIDADRRTDNLSINIGIANKNRRVDNSGPNTSIAHKDRKADNSGTSTGAANEKADALSIDTVDINADGQADGQIAISNKVRTSFFSLCKAFFILIFSSELQTVSTSLFIFLSFLVTLIKQRATFQDAP